MLGRLVGHFEGLEGMLDMVRIFRNVDAASQNEGQCSTRGGYIGLSQEICEL